MHVKPDKKDVKKRKKCLTFTKIFNMMAVERYFSCFHLMKLQLAGSLSSILFTSKIFFVRKLDLDYYIIIIICTEFMDLTL